MPSQKLPLHQRLIGLFYELLQRFAALSIVAFGFVGPFVLGLIALTLPDITEVGYPEEITAEYMVQMSLSPFPDPDNEVLDATERLMQAPKEKPDPDAEIDPDAAPTPKDKDVPVLEQNSDKGAPQPKKPDPVKENTQRPTGRQTAGVQGGNSTKGAGVAEGGVLGSADQEGGKGKAQECLPENTDIKPVNANKWRVKRSMVDYYVNHLNAAQQLAWTAWVEVNGDRRGFRVRRIRCGNDLHQLGFRNKDVVTHVNDVPITSLGEAVQAYLRLRKKNLLVVTIKRRGVERKHTYKLVD
ncbi:MAG: hypothetical protein ACI9VR_003951 [Cognaticolwellia sp.]|jgi:hypothetical protein